MSKQLTLLHFHFAAARLYGKHVSRYASARNILSSSLMGEGTLAPDAGVLREVGRTAEHG